MNRSERHGIRYRVKREAIDGIARKNLSQNAFGREYGISSAYMSQILSGKRCPGPSVRGALVLGLGWKFDELFEAVTRDD